MREVENWCQIRVDDSGSWKLEATELHEPSDPYALTESEEITLSPVRIGGTAPSIGSPVGAFLLVGSRRLVVAAMIATVAYSVLLRGSTGYCGLNVANGGIALMSGRPDDARSCIELVLTPSPLTYIGIGLIVIVALTRAIQSASEGAALRILNQSAIAELALALIAIAISQLWFSVLPLVIFQATPFSIFVPFPFGLIDIAAATNMAP